MAKQMAKPRQKDWLMAILKQTKKEKPKERQMAK